jgi:hypothetical protein
MTGYQAGKLWIGLWTALALAGCGSDEGGPNEPDGPNLEEFQVNTSPITDPGQVRVAAGLDNRFMVVWAASNNLLAQRIDVDGRKVGSELPVAMAASNPSVGLGPQGHALFAYFKPADNGGSMALARRFRPDGSPAGEEFRLGSEAHPYLAGGASVGASTSGTAVIVWAPLTDRTSIVKGQRLAIDGLDAGSELLVASFPGGPSANFLPFPSLSVAPDGAFLVTWWLTDGTLRGQRHASDGSRAGASFDLGRRPDGGSPVALGPDGGFVFVSVRGDHVFLQRHAADGSRIGGEVQVDTAGGVFRNWVSTAPDGRSFAVAWLQSDGVHVQRFAADGSRLGAVRQVLDQASFPVTGQVELALAADGRFLVTWHAQTSVRARLFVD